MHNDMEERSRGLFQHLPGGGRTNEIYRTAGLLRTKPSRSVSKCSDNTYFRESSEVVGMFHQAPRHEGIWDSGDTAPLILNLGTGCEW